MPFIEVCLLVQVFGQVDPRALEDLCEGWLRRPAGDEAVLLVVVRLVGFPVHRQFRQRPLLPPGEEHEGGQVIHLGGVATSAGDDGGVGMGAVELRQIPRSGLVVAGPSLVARADLSQQGLVRHGRPERQELLLQDVVLAAPHGMHLHLHDLPPTRAVLRLASLDARQLPEVAGEHEHGQLVRRLPHLVDALATAGTPRPRSRGRSRPRASDGAADAWGPLPAVASLHGEWRQAGLRGPLPRQRPYAARGGALSGGGLGPRPRELARLPAQDHGGGADLRLAAQGPRARRGRRGRGPQLLRCGLRGPGRESGRGRHGVALQRSLLRAVAHAPHPLRAAQRLPSAGGQSDAGARVLQALRHGAALPAPGSRGLLGREGGGRAAP